MLEDLSHAVGARVKNNCVNIKKKENMFDKNWVETQFS